MNDKFNGKEFVEKYMCKKVRFKYCVKKYKDKKKENGYTRIYKLWERESISPRDGWIIGVTWIRTGYVVPLSGGYDINGFYDVDPGCLKETEPRRLVYLVSIWPTRSPLKVYPEDIQLKVS